MTVRTHEELEAGPLDMTEEEVEHFYPGALTKVSELFQFEKIDPNCRRRYQCDDMDLHLTVVIDAEADYYANFSWRQKRGTWKFSF